MKKIFRFLNQLTAWMRKDTRVVVRGNENWDDGTCYMIKMATPSPQTKITQVIDKNTNVMTPFPEVTGSTSISISTDWISDIVEGINSWINSMDVYVRCQQVDSRGENIGRPYLISIVNPTVGCPWFCVQIGDDDEYYQEYSLYENKGVGIILKDGRSLLITREGDTDVKEWKIDIY